MNHLSNSERFQPQGLGSNGAEAPAKGPSRLKERLSKHFSACTKAATLVAGMAAAGGSSAAIVHWSAANIAIPATTFGVYINVETQVFDPTAANVPGWDLNPWSSSNLSWFNPAAPAGGVYMNGGGGTGPGNLLPGTMVDGAATWLSGNVANGLPAWVLNSSDNYIGFRFEAADLQVHYGWARVQLGADLIDPIRNVIEIAWEDAAGVGIEVGATSTPPLVYCDAGANNDDGTGPDTGFGLDERIINVNVAGINNPSTDAPSVAPAYQDWTAVTGTMMLGVAYPLSIDINTDGNPGFGYLSNQAKIWIDLDQDGVFQDPAELVFTSVIGVGDYTGSITIPSATLGQTRMRIRLYDTEDGTNYPNVANGTPCGLGTYGEVEDYTVNIVPFVPEGPGTNCLFTNNTPLAIVDLTEVTNTIVVPSQGGALIQDMNVYVNVSHTYLEDVTLTLESPAGTLVTLVANLCSFNDDMDVEYDDEATDPAGTTCPPLDVYEIPAFALSAFDGELLEGTWTMHVDDNFTGDDGFLNSWCLIPESAIPGPGFDCGAYTSNTPIPILDNATNSGTIATGALPPGTVLTDLNVYVNATHTWNSDITLTLQSPTGTTVTLVEANCAGNDNMDVEYDDEATDPAGTTCPPLDVYEIPEFALSAFDGEFFEGTWTLSAADAAGGDQGTVNSWCLIPTTTTLSCTPPTITRTVVPACPGGSFSVELDFTALGSGAPYSVTYDLNGVPQIPIAVSTTGPITLTGFANGDDVDIVVVHGNDVACNLTYNNNTFYCPPPNDDCANAVLNPLAPGATVSRSGITNGATNTEGFGFGVTGVVWESFTLSDCVQSLTVEMCGTSPVHALWWGDMYTDCALTPTASLGTGTFTCGDGNLIITFGLLQPGTYYFPVIAHPSVPAGPYQLAFVAGAICPPDPADGCGDPGSFTSNTPIPIVDLATNTGTIVTGALPANTTITDMNVYVDVTHSWNSDVTLTLQSPQGTIVTLVANSCGSEDNMDVLFDDEAAGATCPLTFAYWTPNSPLSAFDGELMEGTWTLSASDNANGDDGQVNSWCLIPTTQVVSCFQPTGLAAAPASTSTANVSWNASAGALTYNVEVRQGGAPGSGGEVFAGSVADPTTTIVANGLTVGQTYDVYVQAICGGGPSNWTGPLSLVQDYCAAGANLLGDPVITNFAFAGINQGNGSNAGYLNFTAATGFVAPGVGSAFALTRSTVYGNDSLVIWADLNDDLDFSDPGEQIYNAAGLNIGVDAGTITIPNGTSSGNKRMRVRRLAVGVGLGGATPCGIAPFGQVHDYTLNVCAPAAATVVPDDITDACANFYVNVTATSFGSGVGATINYSIDGAAQPGVAAVLNSAVALGPFTPGARITVTLDNGTACGLNTGDWYSNCPVTVVCTPPTNYAYTHCYRQGDTRTWTFTNNSIFGETTTLTFTAGTIAVGDVLSVYDGTGPGDLLFTASGVGTPFDLAGSAPITSVLTQSLYVVFTQATSAENCFAETAGFVPIAFNVECTPGCTDPAGNAVVTTSCAPNPEGFSVTVNVTSTESTGPVDVTYVLNGVQQGTVPVAPGGNTVLGPFAYGDVVNSVTLVHEYDAVCDYEVPGAPFAPVNACPPANDDCAGAIVIPVLGPGGCLPGGTVMTTDNATYSLPAAACGTGGVSPVLHDVWFTFNTGTAVGPMYIYFDVVTGSGLFYELFTGSCGALVPVGYCGGGQDLVLNAPGANTQWYARVLANSTSSAASNSFRICVNASQTCVGPSAATGTAPTVTNVTGTSAQFNFTANAGALGTYVVEYGPSATFLYPSSGASAGPNSQVVTTTTATTATGGSIAFLNCLNPATSYRVFVRRDCGGGSFSVNGYFRGTTFTSLAAPPAASAIVPATCAQAAAIPDGGAGFGCAVNNTANRSFTVATTGTQLGVDVSLQSVDVQITHPSRGQLRVRLVSPQGCEYPLILARGGTFDNFGIPGADPTCTPFRLQDGFPAVSTSTGNNVIGTFAPEQPLSAITGNPNGTWHIRVCDGTAATVGTLDFVRLNFVTCVAPLASAPVVVPNPACNGEYSISFNVTSTGNSTGGVVNITNSGGAPALNAQGVGAKVVGPFTYGSGPVTITVVHLGDPSCNVVLAAVNPVNPCHTNAECPVSPAVGIPDNNAAGIQVWYPITHPSTVLGTAPTNAFLESVDIKVTHTWRGDLRVTLTSPGGTTVPLFLQKQSSGDSGDNLGNAAACPSGVLKFKDGATPLLGGWAGSVAPPTYGATGTFAPEAPLAGFTGNPNGIWILTLSDVAAGDVGTLTYFSMNFQTVDCLGIPDGTTTPGSACSAGPGSTIGTYSASCVCSSVACPAPNLNIEYVRDASAVTWSIYEQGTNNLVQTGSFLGNEGDAQTCVPDGCYYLVVTDDGGDGIGGGYVLSQLGSGARIVDNRANFLAGTNSRQAGPGFCLPMSSDRLIFTSCDKMDWRPNEYIVATDNSTVTGIWNSFGAGTPQRAQSGYEMWWFDPNNNLGYTFRRFQSHATTNGLSASATRACHFKINSWSGNQLQQGVLYNVRVRARVFGTPVSETHWGPACRFGVDTERAECPLTKLMDIPGNQYFSCGGSREIGSGGANLVHARQVTRYLNGSSMAAKRYQFRFTTDGGGTVIIKTSALNQYWVNTIGLPPCKQFEVEVRASFVNTGDNWCDTYGGTAFGNPYAPKWGEVCLFNTLGCPTGNGGNQNIALDATNNSGLRMFPNPNRGDQVMLSLDAVEEGVNTVSVDIYDVFGKRVDARTIAVQDNFLNTTIDLNGALASGMYTVNITAGATTYTERLVIQP